MTIVYMVVCDDSVDKYVCTLDNYGSRQTTESREEAVEIRDSRREDFPYNEYYIKDIIL